MYAHLAKATGVRVLLTTYRLAPDARYPAQISDVLDAYRWTLDRFSRVALTGDSAGGGLAVQTALRSPGAACLLLISPWLDMDPALTATTFDTNAATDVFFTREMVRGLIDLYLPPGVSGVDPAVNPFFADLTSLPPVYIQVGGAEGGLGDSERLAALTEKAGVETRLDVFPGLLHSFQMAAGYAPEADDAIARLAAWARPKLDL
jgi:monoterpene epsilon-lactone hydrolase